MIRANLCRLTCRPARPQSSSRLWQQRQAQTIADVLGEEGFARSLSKTDLEYLFAED